MRPQCSFFSTSCTAIFFFTHISFILAQTCYFPDQETVAKDYTPCNSSAIDDVGGTTCCAGGASCLSNNLCYLIWDMSINMGACTDRTWNSPGCFQGCPSGQFSESAALAFLPHRRSEENETAADWVNDALRLRNRQYKHPLSMRQQPMVLFRRWKHH